jgi:hypothetical protein
MASGKPGAVHVDASVYSMILSKLHAKSRLDVVLRAQIEPSLISDGSPPKNR